MSLGKILKLGLFFEKTRKISINEYPLGNIMCIGNFYVVFFAELYQII